MTTTTRAGRPAFVSIGAGAEAETPAQRRNRQQAERRAKAEAQLQETLALVTAMFWSLERDNLSDAQIAACQHDRVLGVLWCRIWDYAEYVSRTRPIRRIAYDDTTSTYLERHFAQAHSEVEAWRRDGTRPIAPCIDAVRKAALKRPARRTD